MIGSYRPIDVRRPTAPGFYRPSQPYRGAACAVCSDCSRFSFCLYLMFLSYKSDMEV